MCIRDRAFTEVIEGFLSQYSEEDEVNVNLVGKYYNEVVREAARRLVLDEGKMCIRDRVMRLS